MKSCSFNTVLSIHDDKSLYHQKYNNHLLEEESFYHFLLSQQITQEVALVDKTHTSVVLNTHDISKAFGDKGADFMLETNSA